MTTFERIKELAKKQGKSLNRVEEELGYGKNVLYRLKDSNPSTERLQEIADYFHVSADYLLGRDDPSSIMEYGKSVDINDDTVIMTLDGKPLSDADRQVVIATTRALLAQREAEKKKNK